MFKVRTEILPVIIGALGTIKRELNQNLELLAGHRSSVKVQTTMMSTAHIICKELGLSL